MEEYFCGDIWTFLHDTRGRVFRYWVFKRMFTPLEADKKYIDQSEFVDSHASFGIIRECVPLPDNDILIGFQDVDISFAGDPENYLNDWISYYKLSEIRLEYHWRDQPEAIEAEEEKEV